MRTSILLGLSVCVAFAGAPAISQVPSSVGAVRTQIQGIEIPPVANAPFTAKIVVTWNQPLVGGGTVTRKYYTLVARDSQGRVRRENRRFVSADSNAEPPLRSFTIIDPVAATRTSCTTASMNCATAAFHPRVTLTEDTGGAPSGSTGKVTRENLGEQTIGDMPVVGTRETVTNTSGSHGSRRLAITRTDIWHSPDLQMDLSVVRSNPQSGQVTLDVTDLVRGEPDSSWFAIPSGYEVNGRRSQ
jgi:hypothetical protein